MSDRAQDSATPEGAPVVILKRLNPSGQIADRCVHFTGIMNDTCAAGVDYHAVRIEHAPIRYRREGSAATYSAVASRPCHLSINLGGATCERRCAPTREAIAARVADDAEQFNHVANAMAAIQAHPEMSGTIQCPRCGNHSLRFSVAAFNGHTHGRCTTQGCLAWMQ